MSDMSQAPETLLEVRHLSKNFGPVEALKDLSMLVRAGEVVALAGDNGAHQGPHWTPEGRENRNHGLCCKRSRRNGRC